MSTPTLTSPNVDNLQVGKGVVSFRKTGDSAFRDLGNVTTLTITPEVTTLEHFSARQGTKKKDLVIVIEQKASCKIVMEEFTAENLALMLYGNVDTLAVGGPTVELMANSSITGELKFVGTNDVGPKITVNLYQVSFQPTGDMNMISDEFNSMEVTANVLVAPLTPGVKAGGVLTGGPGNLSNADTVTIGSTVYTFDTALAATPFHVKIGLTLQATLLNLQKAINLTGISGTDYGAGTTIHPTVSAISDATTLTATAKTAGVAANSIATTEVGTNTVWAASTLLGGLDTNPNAGKFGVAQFTNVLP